MSGSSSGGGGPKDPGQHTQPAGLYHITPLLPIDPSMLDNLTRTELQAVQVARLSYSQDVCTRAALAYQQILAIVAGA